MAKRLGKGDVASVCSRRPKTRNMSERYVGMRFARKPVARIARRICPKCLHVEPFAGHAWVWKELKPEKAVLGDKVGKPLRAIMCIHRKEFTELEPKLLQQDYRKTLRRYDSGNTLFVIDPPFPNNGQSCTERRRRIGWSCDVHIPTVVKEAAKLKGKVIFNISPKMKAVLCKKPFKCRRIETKQANKTFRYLIGVKK